MGVGTPKQPTRSALLQTPRSTSSVQSITDCTDDPSAFIKITIHTAKCTDCDTRNQNDKMLRCPGCTWQVCDKCQERRGIGNLKHGNMPRRDFDLPPPPPRQYPWSPATKARKNSVTPPTGPMLGAEQGSSAEVRANSQATPTASTPVRPPRSTPRRQMESSKRKQTSDSDDDADEDFRPGTESPTPSQPKRPRSDRKVTSKEAKSNETAGPSSQRKKRKPIANRAPPITYTPPLMPRFGRESAGVSMPKAFEDVGNNAGDVFRDASYNHPLRGQGLVDAVDEARREISRKKGLQYRDYDEPLVRGFPFENPVIRGPQGWTRNAPLLGAEDSQKNLQNRTREKLQESRAAQTAKHDEVAANEIAPQAPTSIATAAFPGPRSQTVRQFIDVETTKFQQDFKIDMDQENMLRVSMTEVARKLIARYKEEAPEQYRAQVAFGVGMGWDQLGKPQQAELIEAIQKQGSRLMAEYREEAFQERLAPCSKAGQILPPLSMFQVTPVRSPTRPGLPKPMSASNQMPVHPRGLDATPLPADPERHARASGPGNAAIEPPSNGKEVLHSVGDAHQG